MSSKTAIQDAILVAQALNPATTGWVDLWSENGDCLGAVKLSEGKPVLVSVGDRDYAEDNDTIDHFVREFHKDYPGHTLGEWQAGDGCEAIATVKGA
jgi:hypothetical protein